MHHSTIDKKTWTRVGAAAAAVAVLTGGAALVGTVPAGAKSAVNVFTMKGSYNGSVTVNKKACVILRGEDQSEGPNSYQVALDKLHFAITGLTIKTGSLTFDEPKTGTFHVAHISPTAQSAVRLSADNDGGFSETSGTVTVNGSRGSINLVMAYLAPASLASGTEPTYTGSTTVTGSWSCPKGAYNSQ